MKAKTVLIGLDGATFTILDPLMQDGVMPFLNDFVKSGVRAELTSVIPPLTPPAWTSLITGRSPGHHGVFDFFIKDAPDSIYFRFVNYHDIHAETLWSIANRHGRKVTALNFPFMFPPPHVEGHIVSGFIPWRQLRLGCYPAGLYDRLRTIPGFNPRELAMDMELEAKAVEGRGVDEYGEWAALHVRREQNWLKVLQMLMREEPSQLTAILFDGVDKIQHLAWRFLDKKYDGGNPDPGMQEIREQCLAYFRRLDEVLAEVVSLAGEDATVVLASDHGFGAQTHTFFVNRWLEQAGYLAWADEDKSNRTQTEELGLSQLARHVYLLDWQRTLAYAPTPGGNGIYIVAQSENHPNGVPAAEYESFRNRLREALLSYTDPESGERVVEQVWTREQAFAGPFMPFAPDLTLRLRDSGFVSIVASDEILRRRTVPTGTHRPEGVFMARGPGLQQGVTLPPLSLLDVAPLLLHTMGLPIPAAMEGRVPLEIWQPEVMVERPVEVETQPQAEPVAPAPVGPMMDKEAEKELMQRLRALGYVE